MDKTMTEITGKTTGQSALRYLWGGLLALGLLWPQDTLQAAENTTAEEPGVEAQDTEAQAAKGDVDGDGALAEEDIPYGKGLFWKISREDIEEPSYILGTMHVNDPRVLAIIDEVKPYLLEADVLNLEIDMTWRQGRVTYHMYYRDDEKTLEDILSGDAYARLKEIADFYEIDEEELNQLELWVAYSMLVYGPKDLDKASKEEKKTRVSDEPFLDLKLDEIAWEADIPIKGLERTDEHFNVYKSLSEEQYLEAIEKDAQIMGEPVDNLKDMIDLYEQKNTAAMIRGDYKRLEGQSDELRKTFIYYMLEKRNLLMANRMTRSLYAGNSFTAVGAAHLPGEKGVLKILESRGYTLERLY